MRREYKIAAIVLAVVLIIGIGILGALGTTTVIHIARNDDDNEAITTIENSDEESQEVEAQVSKTSETDSEEDVQSMDNESESTKESSEDTEQEDPAEENQDNQEPEDITPEKLTYTNPFFPGFEIAFDESWRFSTDTTSLASIGQPNLIARETKLTKGGTTLTFFTFPTRVTGCGGFDEPLPLLRSNINGSGINRFDTPDGNGDFYSINNEQTEFCFVSRYFWIETNIKDQNGLQDKNGNLKYWAYITVEGAEHLDEADRIISQSKLTTTTFDQ